MEFEDGGRTIVSGAIRGNYPKKNYPSLVMGQMSEEELLLDTHETFTARGMLTIQIGMFLFHALPNKEVIRHSQISANHTFTIQQKSRLLLSQR